MKGCFKIVVIVVSIISAVLTGLVFIGMLMEPEADIGTLLKKLPERERATLEALCADEGIKPADLRPLGISNDSLLRDERNARSVIIRDGHVRVLCLRGCKVKELHDLSSLTELEALWADNGALTTWPELASLKELTDVQLNGQPLGSPASNYLPTTLKRLGLARTKVSSIDTLMDFAIDEVDLSSTPIAKLPDRVPAKGQWQLKLDDTAILKPAGYQTQLPARTIVSGPTLPGGKIEGMAGHKTVNVRITGSELKGPARLTLPTNTTLYHTSGPIEVTGTVASGALRVWLQEPDGFFDGPWFKAGKIQGFGLAHRAGYTTTEIKSGTPGAARGTLFVDGTPPHFSFAVLLEPVGEAPVTGIDLQLRTTP